MKNNQILQRSQLNRKILIIASTGDRQSPVVPRGRAGPAALGPRFYASGARLDVPEGDRARLAHALRQPHERPRLRPAAAAAAVAEDRCGAAGDRRPNASQREAGEQRRVAAVRVLLLSPADVQPRAGQQLWV